MRFALLCAAFLLFGAASASGATLPAPIGPSFDCEKATQPLAQMICASPRLSKLDLRFAQAYQALRQQVGPAGRRALLQEAIDFQNSVLRECGIPETGPAPHKDHCVAVRYRQERALWLSRLSGPAREEASRPIRQHIALQAKLQALGFLPATAKIDGVYGSATRAAILAWQRANGGPETGFLSDADAAALLGAPAHVASAEARNSAFIRAYWACMRKAWAEDRAKGISIPSPAADMPERIFCRDQARRQVLAESALAPVPLTPPPVASTAGAPPPAHETPAPVNAPSAPSSAPAPKEAASLFNCSNITLPSTAVICGDPELQRLGAERQKAFNEAMARLDPEQRKQLLADQTGWVRSYATACGVPPNRPAPNPVPTAVKECFQQAGKARIAYLQAYRVPPTATASQAPPPASTTGATKAKAAPPNAGPRSPSVPPVASAALSLGSRTEAKEVTKRVLQAKRAHARPTGKETVAAPPNPTLAWLAHNPLAIALLLVPLAAVGFVIALLHRTKRRRGRGELERPAGEQQERTREREQEGRDSAQRTSEEGEEHERLRKRKQQALERADEALELGRTRWKLTEEPAQGKEETEKNREREERERAGREARELASREYEEARKLESEEREYQAAMGPTLAVLVSAHEPEERAAREQPQGATQSRTLKKAKWIPAGRSARVAGFDIGGMVYVGDPQRAERYWQKENCVIDPSAPVAASGADYAGARVPYYPCYASIDPTCRRAYLLWLAGGRNDAGANIGYVFLYFYGLEMRLLVDAPDDEEKRALVAEVERLRGIYGGNGSFAGYSKALLDCRFILLKGEAPVVPTTDCQRSWELPLPVKIGIGGLIARGEPINAEWMLFWWLAYPEAHIRTPATRASEEFGQLFVRRFRERYPDGVKVERPKAVLSHRYRAASATFEKEFGRELGGLPDISQLNLPLSAADGIADRIAEQCVQLGRELPPEIALGAANRIAAECTEALDPYSRYLGRHPDGRGSLEAHALLPPEIRSAVANPAFDALKEWVAKAKTSGSLLVEALIERLTGEAPERITRNMLARASNILAALRTGFAPDPAFSFIAPGRGDAVVLFNLGQGDPPTDAEKKEYQAALLRITLGALVACADGRIDAAERRRLLDHVENTGRLSEACKARLRADLDWLLVSPPELRTLKKHFAELRNEEKAAVGRLLIAVAGAEGAIDASKVALIEKIFDVLGLPTKALYSELHALSTSSPSDEPVTVRSASPGADGYAIPQPEPHERGNAKPQILLDRSRIAAIMEETAKVSRALEAVFADEEPSDDKPSGSGDSNEILLGPDAKHDALVRELLTHSRWSAEEFAQLARHFGLMPEGALEAINEWAFEAHQGLLIEGDGVLEINASVAQLLKAIETRPRP